MIKAAQGYKEELNKRLMETWYDIDYQWFESDVDRHEFTIYDNNIYTTQLVSVDEDDSVVGYLSYSSPFMSKCVCSICAVSFMKPNVQFINDVITHLLSLLLYGHAKVIQFTCYADNPAIDGYRKLIKRFGGKELCTQRNTGYLLDGKYHDSVLFELHVDDMPDGLLQRLCFRR